jgi:arabinofuranosyltransferase
MTGAASERGAGRAGPWLVVAAMVVGVALGAQALAFHCDDAYITFRHIANARDGHGLVWNAPPFAPVEGYTCFLWALLLWAIWSWFGIAPPEAVNALSIGCGVLLFVYVAHRALRVQDRDGRPVAAITALAMLAVIGGNRTFLTWLTSGLETALFELLIVFWVVSAFRPATARTTGWWLRWSTAAALAAWTRPDGLLPVAATAGVAGLALLAPGAPRLRLLLANLPLLLVPAQLVWRWSTYGEWLPNTYYAKVTAPWPEAGVRYLACFLLEHGLWLWPPLALAFAVAAAVRRHPPPDAPLLDRLPAIAAVAVVFGHVGYYTLRVGGDPFEYRVFSHLVPLGGLSALAMAARLRRGAALPIATALALGTASSFGWLHFACAEPELVAFYRPIAAKVPAPLRPIAHWHDRQMAWLQVQVLCGRREVHAMFLASQRASLPERAPVAGNPDDLPLASFAGVGLAGWVLQDCAVLDTLGLNDWVVARTPVAERSTSLLPVEVLTAVLATADTDRDGRFTRMELEAGFGAVPGAPPATTAGVVRLLLLLFADTDPDSLSLAETAGIAPFFTGMRFMAHERIAPADYVQALDPNVTVEQRRVVVRPRAVPLTAERVRAIEAEWRERTLAARRR